MQSQVRGSVVNFRRVQIVNKFSHLHLIGTYSLEKSHGWAFLARLLGLPQHWLVVML
jgi:hypothetical protein